MSRRFGKVHKILLPKDYLRYYLTGSFEMDHSMQLTLLLIRDKEMSRYLEKFHIPVDFMPRLVESAEITGKRINN